MITDHLYKDLYSCFIVIIIIIINIIIIIINIIIVINTALIKCGSVYPVASGEFARLTKHWKGKQEDMESNFKQLYKPGVPTTKQRKGKNCKRVVHSNKELSSYAGSLTKEFIVEVRTSILLSCIS